jgi:hypothetical protein
MTDEQRYITQGKARDAAKKLKTEVATLQAFFREYSERLEHAQSTIVRFLAEPSGRAHDERLFIDHINQLQRQLCEPGFFEATSELIEKSRKLRDLEREIENF